MQISNQMTAGISRSANPRHFQQYFRDIMEVSFIGGAIGEHGENHIPAGSH